MLKNRDARSPKDLFADEPLPAEGEILPEEAAEAEEIIEEVVESADAVPETEEDIHGDQD